MYDCSEVRNQLARWNQTSSEWDDKKSKEVERDYIEPLESGINRMAEMLYEVTDFFVTIESKLAELEEAYTRCSTGLWRQASRIL